MGPKNWEIWQNANFEKIEKLYILSSCFEFSATALKKTTSMFTQSNMSTIESKNKLDGEIKIWRSRSRLQILYFQKCKKVVIFS